MADPSYAKHHFKMRYDPKYRQQQLEYLDNDDPRAYKVQGDAPSLSEALQSLKGNVKAAPRTIQNGISQRKNRQQNSSGVSDDDTDDTTQQSPQQSQESSSSAGSSSTTTATKKVR